MPNPENRINVNLVLDRELKDKFERLYTKQLLKVFIIRCLEKSVSSKDFFDDVFFNI